MKLSFGVLISLGVLCALGVNAQAELFNGPVVRWIRSRRQSCSGYSCSQQSQTATTAKATTPAPANHGVPSQSPSASTSNVQSAPSEKPPRSEAAALEDVQKRVCEEERKLRLKGVVSYSSYNPSYEPLATWEKREKILKNVNAFLEKTPDAAKSISHLNAMGPQGLTGPDSLGTLNIGTDMLWSDVKAHLETIPPFEEFQKQRAENFDVKSDITSKYGLGFNSQMAGAMAPLRTETEILKKLRAALSTFDVEKSMLTQAMVVDPEASFTKEITFSNGNLMIPSNATEAQIADALTKIPVHEGKEAIEEMIALRELTKTNVARDALDKAIKAQQDSSPDTRRQSNKTYLANQIKDEEDRKKRQPEIDAFQTEMKKVAAKLGPDVVIVDEYGATEQSKKLLGKISELADQGLKLTKGSRTIAMTDAWGKGSATQSDRVSGDCRFWTAISAEADDATIRNRFEKK